MNIEGLFPTPIGFFNYDGLSKADEEFLLNQEQRENQGNTSSKNTYILKERQLSGLAHYIDECVAKYFAATYAPKYDVRLKVTQSWLNWTKPGQYHHKHAHPNSLISGCYYVNANKETDKIFFFKDGYRRLKMPPADWNLFNSESWWFPVGSGQLILFPSELTHMVETVQGDDVRVSLAFNTFPTGHIGDELELTELKMDW